MGSAPLPAHPKDFVEPVVQRLGWKWSFRIGIVVCLLFLLNQAFDLGEKVTPFFAPTKSLNDNSLESTDKPNAVDLQIDGRFDAPQIQAPVPAETQNGSIQGTSQTTDNVMRVRERTAEEIVDRLRKVVSDNERKKVVSDCYVGRVTPISGWRCRVRGYPQKQSNELWRIFTLEQLGKRIVSGPMIIAHTADSRAADLRENDTVFLHGEIADADILAVQLSNATFVLNNSDGVDPVSP